MLPFLRPPSPVGHVGLISYKPYVKLLWLNGDCKLVLYKPNFTVINVYIQGVNYIINTYNTFVLHTYLIRRQQIFIRKQNK